MASQFVKIVNGFPVISIGDLRHQVQVQQQTVSGAYDASGVADSTWTTIATCMAAIGTSGQGLKTPTDVQHGGQAVSQLFTEVALYFCECPTLTPNMRVITDTGSVYLIQAAENVMELSYVWVLSCIGLGANV